MLQRKAVMPLSTAKSDLTATQQNLANKQIITDVMANPNADPSITVINPGKVANFKPLAPKFTVTVENTNESEKECFVFNESFFNASPAGVTVSYSDGFAGKLINKWAQSDNGLLLFGFNITGYDEDNVKSDAVVNSSALEMRYYNGYGTSYVPVPIDVAGAERNTQFKDGLFTVKSQNIVNMLAQLKLTLGAGCKIQFVFFTQPVQD